MPSALPCPPHPASPLAPGCKACCVLTRLTLGVFPQPSSGADAVLGMPGGCMSGHAILRSPCLCDFHMGSECPESVFGLTLAMFGGHRAAMLRSRCDFMPLVTSHGLACLCPSSRVPSARHTRHAQSSGRLLFLCADGPWEGLGQKPMYRDGSF